MALPTSHRNVIAMSALLLGGPAYASTVGLTPFLPGKGVSQETVMDVFSLISSELEFMEGIDEVIELDPKPASLSYGCLDATNCLGAIAYDAEADYLIGGTIDKDGNDFAVDILYYDASVNRVLRRKSYILPTTATELVDAITPVLVETVTGRSPKAEARENEELLDTEFETAPEPVYEPEPRRREPAPEPEPATQEFDPSDISFGDSAEDISFGTASEEITYGDQPATREPPPREPPPRFEEEDDRIRPPSTRTERGPRPKWEEEANTSRTSGRSSKSRSNAPSEDFRRVHIAVRGGYTNFGVFHFATGGGEFKVHAAGGLFITLGIDAHIVRREKAPALVAAEDCKVPLDASGRCIETGFIFPFNLGVLYHFKGGRFQPYLGADAIAAQYFRDPAGQNKWTFGARARLGADFLVSDHFGFNLDVAAGFWLGEDWPQVDPRLRPIGFAPHVGAGLVFAF